MRLVLLWTSMLVISLVALGPTGIDGVPVAADGADVHLPVVYGLGGMSHRQVNAPFFSGDVRFSETAVFWLGRVTPTENYADVRVGYNAQELWVHFSVFDRRLWYDTTPSAADLIAWDAVTLLLDLDGGLAHTPGQNAYRLRTQLTWMGNPSVFRIAERGNGAGWTGASVPFNAEPVWRGDGEADEGLNNNSNNRGWWVTCRIPWSSLGLSQPPHGAVWGLGVQLHDRDDAAGTSIADKVWPPAMSTLQPETWGRLYFGQPTYTPPSLSEPGSVTIRRGLNDAAVHDASVGGWTVCGQGTDFFGQWGDTNEGFYRPARDQVNVMNQKDVADWPCFSKFYVAFPLSYVPAGKTIISATLTLHQFGSAGAAGSSSREFIQVHSVGEDWNDLTVTWNNAPQAVENFGGRWVDPWSGPLVWPGLRWDWDVTRAVASAYGREPWLRLVLYSSDQNRHSGKYFSSSDTGDWNAVARPTLTVAWAGS